MRAFRLFSNRVLQPTAQEADGRRVAVVQIEAADAGLLQDSAVTVFGTDKEELKQVGALRDVSVVAGDQTRIARVLTPPANRYLASDRLRGG